MRVPARVAIIVLVVAAVASAYALGWRQGQKLAGSVPVAPIESNEGRILAAYAGGAITTTEFVSQVQADSFGRQQASTPAGRKQLLDVMVRDRLVSLAAAEKGYDRDPGVLAQARHAMVAKFMSDEFGEAAVRAKLSDDEMKSWFNEHRGEFARPERVRASMVLFRSDAGSADRETKLALAKRTLAEVRKRLEKDPDAMRAVARARSEDPETRALDGDTRFLSRQEMSKRWGPEVAAAAFAPRAAGTLSDVLESPAGFVILRTENFDPGAEPSLADMKETIRGRLTHEKRTKMIEEFVDRLKKDRAVFIDENALEAVQITSSPPPAGGTRP